jgi:hypothetical protein
MSNDSFAFTAASETAVDTFVEYVKSFVNYARALGTFVELPLSEFSHQSCTPSDGETYSVADAGNDETDTATDPGMNTNSSALRKCMSLGLVSIAVALTIVM